VLPYYLTKVIVETPIMLVTPLIFQLVVFFGMGLTITGGQFFMFYIILVLVVFTASSLGYLLSSIFPTA
jgi:ABC-type multidrug transport system permease subunit